MELGYRMNFGRGVKNSCIEISKGNKIEFERQVVKKCENYIRSVLLIYWARKPELETEYEVNTTIIALIFCSVNRRKRSENSDRTDQQHR